MNDYLTRVLDAATNPDLAATEIEQVRERLARAGLLADGGRQRHAPDPGAVARARARAGSGTALSELVDRGQE